MFEPLTEPWPEQKHFFGRFYTRGRIIRLDELSSVVRLERSTSEDSSSRRIMRPLEKQRPFLEIFIFFLTISLITKVNL